MKLKENKLKQLSDSTQVNLSNSRSGPWDRYNPIKNKLE
jgi:hypothetical protein